MDVTAVARAVPPQLLTDASMASVIETIFPGSTHAQRREDGRIIVNLAHSNLRKPLDSQRNQPMVRQLPIRRLIHAAVFVLSVAPFVACENYEDAPERRLRASAQSNAYFRTTDIDCQALNTSSDLNYLGGLRPASQLSLSRSTLGTDIDALVLQIAHASFSRILLDPGGYASDLRAVASLIDDNSDEYATRVFIAAECFANTEPARYWLYRQLVWYVVNHDQMLARRQSIIADQVETDPQALWMLPGAELSIEIHSAIARTRIHTQMICDPLQTRSILIWRLSGFSSVVWRSSKGGRPTWCFRILRRRTGTGDSHELFGVDTWCTTHLSAQNRNRLARCC